jgi:hypothetical protein
VIRLLDRCRLLGGLPGSHVQTGTAGGEMRGKLPPHPRIPEIANVLGGRGDGFRFALALDARAIWFAMWTIRS